MSTTVKTLRGITSSKELVDLITRISKEAKEKSVANESASSIEELEKILADPESSSHLPLKAILITKSIAPTKTSLKDLESYLKEHTQTSNDSSNKIQLCYNSPDKKGPSKDYQSRIESLKLMEQERQYCSITKNLDQSKSEDATIKSMMYAASVGMNMIVAPISIGVLMYFFAGKLFAFMIPNYQQVDDGKLNIHGVIAGVISGVIMLFIEMILFVIRNHEMDKFVTKKMKTKKNPFGYDKKTAQRTFQG